MIRDIFQKQLVQSIIAGVISGLIVVYFFQYSFINSIENRHKINTLRDVSIKGIRMVNQLKSIQDDGVLVPLHKAAIIEDNFDFSPFQSSRELYPALIDFYDSYLVYVKAIDLNNKRNEVARKYSITHYPLRNDKLVSFLSKDKELKVLFNEARETSKTASKRICDSLSELRRNTKKKYGEKTWITGSCYY